MVARLSSVPDVVLLAGLDRSGTSAVSRTLARHPQVELWMQPFNSSVFRTRMYEVLGGASECPQEYQFAANLFQGVIDPGLIKSEWFFKYSTTTTAVAGHLHLVKTTISHLHAHWFAEHFENVEVLSIWRDPVEVIRSVFRNQFQHWYAGSLQPIRDLVSQVRFLSDLFPMRLFEDLTPLGEVAANFAVRSAFLLHHLPVGKTIPYQLFCDDPNLLLNRFCQQRGLPEFDFSRFAADDLNLLGARESSPAGITDEETRRIEKYFAPLRDLVDRHQLTRG